YGPSRKNSAGVEFGDRASLESLLSDVKNAGPLAQAKGGNVQDALAGAARGFAAWNATPLGERAASLERSADLFERHRDGLIALPAEQTPQVGAAAVALMHEAGIPTTALHIVLGDGKVGTALVADPCLVGVAFTGSTEVARLINRSLAGKDGPIVPLIAETG